MSRLYMLFTTTEGFQTIFKGTSNSKIKHNSIQQSYLNIIVVVFIKNIGYISDKSVHVPSTVLNIWISTYRLHSCGQMCDSLKVHSFGKNRTFGNNYVWYNALWRLDKPQTAQKDFISLSGEIKKVSIKKVAHHMSGHKTSSLTSYDTYWCKPGIRGCHFCIYTCRHNNLMNFYVEERTVQPWRPWM